MSFSMSGIIFKNGTILSNNTLLRIAERENYYESNNITFDEATSGDFEETAIARIGNIAFLLNKYITHSCSYEANELSDLDKELQELSKDGDILTFLLHGVSDTYAFSLFREGERVRGGMISSGEWIGNFGTPGYYDKGLNFNEQDLIKLISNFTGYPFADLFLDAPVKVTAYYK